MIKYCITLLLIFLPVNIYSYSFNGSAKQAILIDYQSGAILHEHAADETMHPSSMSKLMTLYVAFSKLKAGTISMNDLYTVSKQAWKIGGSSMFLEAGQLVTVKDLLYGIIILSGNDASVTLAEGASGSQENFVAEMNSMAHSIGLTNSTFINPTGLTNDGHMMSARDLLKLAIRIYEEFPEYYHLFQEKKFLYNKILQPNTNNLLLSNLGVDGIKTGYTDAGGYGIVISAIKDQRRIFAVINGLTTKADRNQEGRQLVQYGFNSFSNKLLFEAGEEVSSTRVWFGDTTSIPIIVDKDVFITHKTNNLKKITASVVHHDIIKAPIEKNQRVGTLKISIPDQKTQEIPLYSAKSVKELSGLPRLIRTIRLKLHLF